MILISNVITSPLQPLTFNPVVISHSYVGDGRVPERYIWYAIKYHAEQNISGVTFYYPEQEPNFKNLNAWAMLMVDVSDDYLRGEQYIGKGRLSFDIGKRRTISGVTNVQGAKSISSDISDLFAGKTITVDVSGDTVAFLRFGKAAPTSTGEIDGVLTHYWTAEFRVYTN